MFRNREAGITMIEVMMTIAMVAIASSMAVPGIVSYLPDYRLSKAARDFASISQTAKMTAIRSNTNCAITFYQTANGKRYDYVAFQDTDGDFEYDNGERIIAAVRWDDYKGVSIDTTQGGGNGVTFTDNDDGLPCFAFASNGVTRNNLNGFGGGSVFLNNKNKKEKNIRISPMGSIEIE